MTDSKSVIDNSFDFRSDAGGRDPDQHSPTLRMYHKVLWSKELPDGHFFELSTDEPGHYLFHNSSRGQYTLASDGMIPSYRNWKRAQGLIALADEESVTEFQRLTYTIGGSIVFPRNRIDNRMTINGARGVAKAIADRFDLTLECIRRHYLGHISPLSGTLSNYKTFFDLFETFDQYVEFFALQDMVSGGQVRHFLPFNDFVEAPIPATLKDYNYYMANAVEFLTKRGLRLASSR